MLPKSRVKQKPRTFEFPIFALAEFKDIRSRIQKEALTV